MPCALVYDVPADPATYRRVRALIGDDVPDGLIAHTVVAVASGLRHFGVWESRAHFDRFELERAQPAVHAVLRELGLTVMPPHPPVQEVELVDYWVGAHGRGGSSGQASVAMR
jgi:hypothetical protein